MAEVNNFFVNENNRKYFITTKKVGTDNSRSTTNNRDKCVMAGLSLVALSTTAGLIYYAGRTKSLKKEIEVLKKPLTTLQGAEECSAHVVTAEVNSVKKEGVEHLISEGSSLEQHVTELNKTQEALSVNNKKRGRVVKGSIRKISVDLKEYLKTCQNNRVNPEKLDEILTNAVGESNVVERAFVTNEAHKKGRVKHFHSPNGRVYVLEAHDSPTGNVTRLYMFDKDKNLRAYLFPDGTFRLNSYAMSDAHFITSHKGKAWIDKSDFNINKTL